MTLKHGNSPLHGTCEYVTFHGKRDFVDAIMLRILRRDYPALFRWNQGSHKSCYKRKAGVLESERDLKMLLCKLDDSILTITLPKRYLGSGRERGDIVLLHTKFW